MAIKLTDTVRSKVTGFVGVAVSRVEHINGCVQFVVSPKVDKNNKPQESKMIDEGSLEVVKSGKKPAKKKTGGPVSKLPARGY